ncbi:MAG: 50S ribosomal protein L23 [Fluviicola sp.]|jgi:large subunit ribosomal protein L23|nr:50S ribosomal protein L23 [Fluviicola sp.]
MSTIIKKPIITEKATAAADKSNSFSFEVDRKANKLQIKSAVEKMYGVNVVDVRTLTYGGGKSSVKFTNKGVVEQPSKVWKKAVVTVAAGETIDLFNNF